MTGIIYARVSSIGERQNTERQIEDLTKYAENNGIDLVKVFSEKISGAKKNNERAILMECFEYAETNKIDVILVSECSRVGRAIWEVLESVKYCVDRHVDIFFQKENLHIFDANGEVNPFMAVYISCLGMCAQIERQNIMFRLNSGRQLAIQRGVKMGRKVGSTKTQEQKQAEYKDIIKLLRKGYSVASTYAIAKERGIKCSISTIKRVKKEFLK
jgi:DNA invertase Pin-like site-specific DNA recombinase